MAYKIRLVLAAMLFLNSLAFASVTPEYATNTYTEHNLSRSEKKCIEEQFVAVTL